MVNYCQSYQYSMPGRAHYLGELMLKHVDLVHEGSLLLVKLPQRLLLAFVLPLKVLQDNTTN